MEGILKSLLRNIDEVKIHEIGCRALCNLAANDEENGRVIISAGGIETLIQSIMRHSTAEKLCVQAVWAISNILCFPSNLENILSKVVVTKREGKGDVRVNILDAILICMSAHPHSVEIQEQGSWGLAHLAYCESTRGAVAEGGGAEIVCNAMKVHPNNLQIGEQGCWVISNLSCDGKTAGAAISSGAVQIVLDVLRGGLNEDSETTIESAVTCLELLSLWRENGLEISERGGAVLAVQAMQRHTNNINIQQHACALLRNISAHPKNISKVVKSGGVTAATKCLSEYNGNPAVLEQAFAVLAACAVDGDCQYEIIKNNILRTSLKFLTDSPSLSSQMLMTEVLALLRSVVTHENLKIEFQSIGGISVIVSVLENEISSAELAEHLAGVVSILAENDSLRESILATGALVSLLRLAHKFENENKTATQFCRAFSNLAGDDATAIRVGRSGAAEYVVKVLGRFLDDPDVCEQACWALANISSTDEALRVLTPLSVCPLIVNAIEKHFRACISVAEQGMCALTFLSGVEENRVATVRAGGINISILCLSECVENFEVVEQALWLVANLSSSEFGRQKLAECGGMPAIISATKFHLNKISLLEASLHALSTIANVSEKGKESVREGRGLQLIFDIIAANLSALRLVQISLSSLHSLTYKNEHNTIEVCFRGLSPLLSLLTPPSPPFDDEMCVQAALKLLLVCAPNENSTEILSSAESAAALAGTLARYRHSEQISLSTLSLFSHISKKGFLSHFRGSNFAAELSLSAPTASEKLRNEISSALEALKLK